MLLKPGILSAVLFFFFFFLTMTIDRTGVYSVYFYLTALIFLYLLTKESKLLFGEGPYPFFLFVLVFLVVYLALANIVVLGFQSSYRALGNSVETMLFIFMAYSASLVFLNNQALFSNLFFLLVFFGFSSVAYTYLLDGYGLQRIVGSGFLSKAILGPSVLFVYWLLGCFLFFSIEAKLKDIFVFFVATVCLLVYALLSQSRGPIIAVSVSVFCLFFMSFFYDNKKKLASSLSVLLLSSLTVSYVFSNLVSLSSLFQRGSSYRPEIWTAVMESMKESFWLGNGVMAEFNEGPANRMLLESVGFDIHHAHNTFIQLFYDGGFIGLSIFVVAMAAMACEVIFKHSAKQEKYWVGFVFLGMVMINFTDTSKFISSPKEGWIMLWLPMAFIAAWISKDNIKRCTNG